jgi:hypothetical protein
MKFEFDKFIAVVKVDSSLQRDYIIYPEKELEKAAKLMVGMDVIANLIKTICRSYSFGSIYW